MTAPEIPGSTETNILSTEIPGTTVRVLTPEDLPAVKELMDSNFKHFANGGIMSDGLYSMISRELASGNSQNQRMGIWQNDTLVGYIGTNPVEDDPYGKEVEVAYAIDEKHSGKGLASAAIEVVAQLENDKGKDVVAEVEGRNIRSKRLLGKLGFEHTMRRNSDGREVFVRHAMSPEEMMRNLGML